MDCPECRGPLRRKARRLHCPACERVWSIGELEEAAWDAMSADLDALTAELQKVRLERDQAQQDAQAWKERVAQLKHLLSQANAFVIGWANGHGFVDEKGDSHPSEIAMRLQRRMAAAIAEDVKSVEEGNAS